WAGSQSQWLAGLLSGVCRAYALDPDTPLGKLPQKCIDVLLYGAPEQVSFEYRNARGRVRTFTSPFEGVVAHLERRYREAQSDWARGEVEQYMSTQPCPDCRGGRLRPESLAVTVAGKNINDVTAM